MKEAGKKDPVQQRIPGPRGKYTIACDMCHGKGIKSDGVKHLCGPCHMSGRQLECTWNKNPAPKPRREQQSESEALHAKRAENLCKVLNEYRRYADYLESVLDRQTIGNIRVDFRAFRPSIPEGLMETIPIEPQYAKFMHLQKDEESQSDDPTLQIQHFNGLKVDEGGQILHHGDTAPLESSTQPSRFSAISEDPKEAYVLIVDAKSEAHFDPDFEWARHLPSAVPLDRRSHDKALDLFFKLFTAWCIRIDPDLFLHDMHRALNVPPSQDPPKTPHYSPMLHNSLVALALAFLDDPKLRDIQARQYFAEKAKGFLEAECQKPNISVVQALSLLGSFHSTQGDQTLGYLYFGLSAQVSLALGDSTAWVKYESDLQDQKNLDGQTSEPKCDIPPSFSFESRQMHTQGTSS